MNTLAIARPQPNESEATRPESEEALIGAALLEPATIEVASRIVSASDFADSDLGGVFGLLVELKADGHPVDDLPFLIGRLRAVGLLDRIGGPAGLGKLTCACGHPSRAQSYAQEIADAAAKRRILSHASHLIERASDAAASVSDILAFMEYGVKRCSGGSRFNSRTIHNAADLLEGWLDRLRSGSVPQLLRLGSALDGIEVGEGLITLFGAPPGAGKTALASQIVFEAIEHKNDLPVYLCNAEMGFGSLLNRQFSAITRINSKRIRFGELSVDEHNQIEREAAAIRNLLLRITVFDPCDHESLLELLDKPPGLVVVDYLQKFAPPDKDARQGVNTVMATMRRLASHGHAVVALSATKRDAKGRHDSKELDLSSFRESGECEYNADSAYVMRDEGPVDVGCEYVRLVTLAHVKNRHGAKEDRELEFHMPRMEFSSRQPVVITEFNGYEGDDPFADGEDDF